MKMAFPGSSRHSMMMKMSKAGFLEFEVNDAGRWCSKLPGDLPESVCGDGWFNLPTLISQCATGVQPHLAPQSQQSESTL